MAPAMSGWNASRIWWTGRCRATDARNPCLRFPNGDCKAAFDLYQQVPGAETRTGTGVRPSVRVQIGLDPPRRVVDVDRLQATRPEVLESMRNASGTEEDVAGGGVDGR